MTRNYEYRFVLSTLVALCVGPSSTSQFLAFAENLVIPNSHAECVGWAEQNECTNNPRFMWGACVQSCLKVTRDSHADCQRWAQEGECTSNPGYMHANCAESCQFGILWNRHVREALNIDRVTANTIEVGRALPSFSAEPLPDGTPAQVLSAEEPCEVPMHALAAAEILRARLNKVMSGGYNIVRGLSATSPSEYLTMAGLAEAFLYALRLYEVVIRSREKAEDGLANRNLSAGAVDLISEIIRVLGSGYSSDLLARNLPVWMKRVNEISRTAHEVVNTPVEGREEEENLVLSMNRYDKGCPSSYGALLDAVSVYFELTRNVEIAALSGEPAYPAEILLNAQKSSEIEQETGGLAGSLASTPSTVPETIALNNGLRMPVLGLGTWQLSGAVCSDAVTEAIRVGYRHIDTAEAYGNEREVGEGIEQAITLGYISRREEVFVAHKISMTENLQTPEDVVALVMTQLQVMQMTYLDLYMLHSPVQPPAKQIMIWQALESLYDQGILRALGVSNFDKRDLEPMLEGEMYRIKPVAVQNKLDVYHVGKQLDATGSDIVNYARFHGVVVVAYSSFSSYPFVMLPTEDPIVKYIAASHTQRVQAYLDENNNNKDNKDDNIVTKTGVKGAAEKGGKERKLAAKTTPAQVLLRWNLQKQGIAMIPRSSSPANLRSNYFALKMLPLLPVEMDLLDTLQYMVSSPVSKPIPI